MAARSVATSLPYIISKSHAKALWNLTATFDLLYTYTLNPQLNLWSGNNQRAFQS